MKKDTMDPRTSQGESLLSRVGPGLALAFTIILNRSEHVLLALKKYTITKSLRVFYFAGRSLGIVVVYLGLYVG